MPPFAPSADAHEPVARYYYFIFNYYQLLEIIFNYYQLLENFNFQ